MPLIRIIKTESMTTACGPCFGEYLLMNNLPKRRPATGRESLGSGRGGWGQGGGGAVAAAWGWVLVAPAQPCGGWGELWRGRLGLSPGELPCHALNGQNCVPPNS